MSRQLTLGVQLPQNTDFNNFLPADNVELVTLLQTLPNAQESQYLLMTGEAGAGKSHLLQASCRNIQAQGLTAIYLPLREFQQFDIDLLQGLENSGIVCFDDIDTIAGNRVWEESIFHCFNRLREQQVMLVVSATVSPASMGLVIPDLESRLQWGVSYKLAPLNDRQRIEALQLRAQCRGFELSDETAAYLLKRVSRQMTDLFNLLDKLDMASLAAQRKLTIPFVRELLSL